MRYYYILFLFFLSVSTFSQTDNYNELTDDGRFSPAGQRDRFSRDSTSASHKEVPVGLRTWTVDERFGDIKTVTPDTLSHMFMNTIFTSGLYGQYNTTGNVGAPRINRIFTDRRISRQFIFTEPYDFFITPVDEFHFTNTLSPFTNLSYNECGDRTQGENHFKAKFGVNAGKKIGAGFLFDYIYGRGYYNSQNTSLFGYSMYGSYIGDRYQAHLLLTTNHQKIAENGGITNDEYIMHPESFNEDFSSAEIPTVLTRNWNRNDNQHIFFTHRYNVGFTRKVPMTKEEIAAVSFNTPVKNEPKPMGRPENAVIAGDMPLAGNDNQTRQEGRIIVADNQTADSLIASENAQRADSVMMKEEYVPVTSFIHTMKLDNYKRIYQAYSSPENYYLNTYYDKYKFSGDSIYDKTRHYELRNTLAVSLLEGFNKWAKAGMKIFANSYLRHFELPDLNEGISTYNEHNLSIGAQISKTQGHTLHYTATAETFLLGEDAGSLKLDATADLNFKLFGDTVTLAASGFIHRTTPTFYMRHYHSKHFWWDNSDLDKTTHTRLQGMFHYAKTRTTLRIAADELENYVFFAQNSKTENSQTTAVDMNVRQKGTIISLLTLSLKQDFTFGPLNWETILTYQKSTEQDYLPVPDLNIYSNLYMRFKIARVLKCDMGADVRYFTSYAAPLYNPALGQFAVQENEEKTEIGNYPIINVYANFHLKHTRFYIMMEHVNAGSGRRAYFVSPHYPMNERVLRFGLSWNFFN